MDTLERFETIVRNLYLPEGYHDQHHPDDVTSYALKLADRAATCDVTVDRSILRAGCAVHDALFALPPAFYTRLNGSTPTYKEEVAADVAARLLAWLGFGDEFIRQVELATLGTNPYFSLPTIEARLLAAADINNLAGDYERYVAEGERIRLESARLLGVSPVEPVAFVRGSAAYLALFLRRMITVTPFALTDDGRSWFHTQAMANILRRIDEFFHESLTIAEFSAGPNSLMVTDRRLAKHDDILLSFHEDESDRTSTLSTVKSLYVPSGGASPITFALPLTQGGLSLPEATCDRVYIDVSENHWTKWPQEHTASLLKPGGQAIFYTTAAKPPTFDGRLAARLLKWLAPTGLYRIHEEVIPYRALSGETATTMFRMEYTFVKSPSDPRL